MVRPGCTAVWSSGVSTKRERELIYTEGNSEKVSRVQGEVFSLSLSGWVQGELGALSLWVRVLFCPEMFTPGMLVMDMSCSPLPQSDRQAGQRYSREAAEQHGNAQYTSA